MIRKSPLHALLPLSLIALFTAAAACETGGKEGDRCNPLVLHDECDDGLQCTAVSCTTNYCCPKSGVSNKPNCQVTVCPDADAAPPDDAAAPADAGTD